MEVTLYKLMFLTIFIIVENFMEENCGSQKDWFFMSRPERNIFIAYGSSIWSVLNHNYILLPWVSTYTLKPKPGWKMSNIIQNCLKIPCPEYMEWLYSINKEWKF